MNYHQTQISTGDTNRTCRLVFTVVMMLVVNCCATPLVGQKPSLNSENYQQWREHILPQEQDLAWSEIDWQVTFADGIRAANETDKPLLLWVMNGHPLGCT